MKRIIYIFPILGIFLILSTFSFKNPIFDKDYWLEYISTHFHEYIQEYPQQKVYLQLDRTEYKTGSTIWFKAYVYNDTKKLPDTQSKNLYIELISPTKKVFMNRLLKIENGYAYGDLPVHDTIGTGLYMIRAFTNNMKNSGKEYLFSKEISIVNPKKINYSKVYHKEAKRLSKKTEDIDIQFFPEGGDLVDKLKTTLAFKAINQKGLGMDVKGQIYTKKKVLVADFKSDHKGMGKIDFRPEKDEKYYAIVENEDGKKTKAELPEILSEGYVLNIEDKAGEFSVKIQTNKVFGSDPVARAIYIFAQNGGKIYYKEKLSFESNQIELEIDKKYFPSGIIHFTLFDGQGKAHCERLAFVNKHDQLKISSNLELKNVRKRDKIEFDLFVTDQKGNPVTADLSISVKNKSTKTSIAESSSNIKNYFLLQSDLTGNIEDPAYYFNDGAQQSKNLELLLLTQGWRKFVWENILQDSIPKAKHPIEIDIRITGRITKYFFDISVNDVDLTLTLLNQFNDVFKTKSGEKGKFAFTALDYNDTIDVLIEARTKYSRKNVLILPDESVALNNDFYPIKDFYLDSLKIKRKIAYIKYKEPKPDPDQPTEHKLYNQADQVVPFDDKTFSSHTSVMDALKGRVPGMQVNNGSATIRGPSSIYGSNEPLYLIDGIQTDYNAVQSINVNDVERVDILKGPSAAIYGLNGANGVIAVYTKRGFFYKRGEIRFKMLGYHTPKKFYSPKYEVIDEKAIKADTRKTVYWNPSVKTNLSGKAKVSFYQSDMIDDFEVIVEGMAKNGKVGTYVFSYTVNELN